MPRGVYQRSEEHRRKLRENMKKASAALTLETMQKNLRKARAALTLETMRKNAAKAAAAAKAAGVPKKNGTLVACRRIGRALLKNMPLGAKPGDSFRSWTRTLVVIDPAPVKIADGVWEQKFSQRVQVNVYGEKHFFSGTARVWWDYEPTAENIMDKPRFENLDMIEIPDPGNGA